MYKRMQLHAFGVSVMALLIGVVPTADAGGASELGKSLTRFGAVAAGNADGSIPAYKGGVQAPASFKPGADRYPDPFANEKPLYSITKDNLAQYKAELSEGTVAMFQYYPDYRIDVYPTHRSIRYPKWFLDNTVKNDGTTKLEGAVEGDKVVGAAPDGYPFQGIPFRAKAILSTIQHPHLPDKQPHCILFHRIQPCRHFGHGLT